LGSYTVHIFSTIPIPIFLARFFAKHSHSSYTVVITGVAVAPVPSPMI
jgi:hypothetical protein